MSIAAPPADVDIRPALKNWLRTTIAEGSDSVLLEELGVCRGRVRVDLAVVNGMLHGFEIKSDRDSLRRLAGQATLYSAVFDRVTLVVGGRHLAAAMALAPSWWGLLRVDAAGDGLRFVTCRRGRKNPGRHARSLVELLWLEDAIALLEERRLALGIRGKPRRLIWDRICENLKIEEISAAVRARLKARARKSLLQ